MGKFEKKSKQKNLPLFPLCRIFQIRFLILSRWFDITRIRISIYFFPFIRMGFELSHSDAFARQIRYYRIAVGTDAKSQRNAYSFDSHGKRDSFIEVKIVRWLKLEIFLNKMHTKCKTIRKIHNIEIPSIKPERKISEIIEIFHSLVWISRAYFRLIIIIIISSSNPRFKLKFEIRTSMQYRKLQIYTINTLFFLYCEWRTMMMMNPCKFNEW